MNYLTKLGALGALVWLAGCTRPATAVVVQIDSDLAVPAALDTVEVETLDGQGLRIATHTFGVASGSPRVPFSFTVVPSEADDLALSLRITARGRDGVSFERRWSSRFSPEETLFVSFFLTAACRDLRCTEAGQTCGDQGRCVDAYTDPARLPVYAPNLEVRRDAGVDTGRDLGPDAPLDAGQDVPTDRGQDVPFDAGQDVPTDRVVPDAPVDRGADLGGDVVGDRGQDVPVDRGVDAPPVLDAGPPARPPRPLAVGRNHACAVRRGNEVWCWGSNATAQLGEAPAAVPESPAPRGVATLPRVPWAELVAGRDHACALPVASTGVRPWCWGSNGFGQVDPTLSADTSLPRQINFDNVVTLCAGERHTCAANAAGQVRCWGDNSARQVDPEQPQRVGVLGQPVMLPSMQVTRLACGARHTCALMADAQIYCWGDNARAQLGQGDVMEVSGVVRVAPSLGGGDVPVDLSAGSQFTCFRSQMGVVRCWGDSSQNQIYPASTTPATGPYPPNLTGAALNLSAGALHACVVLPDTRVQCWGDNDYLQVGVPRTGGNPVPGAGIVDGLVGAVAVEAGDVSTCAMMQNGGITCWGDNASGQIGDGSLLRRAQPVQVALSGEARRVAVGLHNTCALLANGTIQCWGGNDSGQLGNLTTMPSGRPASTVRNDQNVVIAGASELELGVDFGCARVNDRLFCWGENSGTSVLGQNTLRDSSAAVSVPLTGVTQFSVGLQHVCAMASGTPYCWGSNARQQSDYNVTATVVMQPRAISVPNATAVSAGFDTTLVVHNQNRFLAQGANGDGQLGVGMYTAINRVNWSLSATSAEVRFGLNHACARVAENGTVWCWGSNAVSQVAEVNPATRTTPHEVRAFELSTQIAATAATSCAVIGTALRCVGGNTYYQLGVDDRTASSTAVQVPLAAAVVFAASGASANHQCAVVRGTTLAQGPVFCWGSNEFGQLGDGTCGRSVCAPSTVREFP